MDLLKNLNPMQEEAVRHIEGPLLILAGAGSGKTRVLTHRIAYLIENGIAPFNILAITFTNKASKEMRERVDSLISRGDQVWVSTFHSMCVKILRKSINKINFDSNFTIYDTDDSERLIKKCIKELNVNDKQYPHKSVMFQISTWKDELYTPAMVERDFSADYRAITIGKVYRLYQKRLKENNALDFDDIIFRAVELFVTRPEVLEKYQERFKYIMVDEYQDTNTSQYKLIRLLSKKYKNLCVVGDDDQSIYGWRGANIRNILEFEKDFKNSKVIKLEQNYRSTQTILNVANSVIKNNTGRKEKSLWTDNNSGALIAYFKAATDYEESEFVADKISEFAKKGAKYNDHAILYRNNAQSRSLEEKLISKNIPYRIFGGIRFYDRKEIKDVLAYLRLINNPKDSVSLLRIINVPRRGIGDTTVDKIYDYAANNDMSLFDSLKELENIEGLSTRVKRIDDFKQLIIDFIDFAQSHTVVEVINKVLFETNYLGEIIAERTEESEGRAENIHEFISKASEFEQNSDDKSLTAFLEELALVSDLDSYTEKDDTVTLMTLHSSKGLEFPCVFMVGMEEGIFPSYRSSTSSDKKDLEEERRICYVGITRARERLYLSSSSSRRHHGQTVYNSPSRFLKEIPQDLMENVFMITENDKNKTERTGISQFAEINKVKNSIDISFGGKNYTSKPNISEPQNVELDFNIGDKVRQMKYGVGVVKNISPAGADYEVSVEFDDIGIKKFMAKLSKLKKVAD